MDYLGFNSKGDDRMDEDRWMTYAASALRIAMKWTIAGNPTDEALRAARIGWACEYADHMLIEHKRRFPPPNPPPAPYR
jgi:hypothetical protein